MSLRKKTLAGIRWTTFSTTIISVIQLLQLGILARLLDPTAFGLMALIMVVVGFSQFFLDMGVSNAIIHKQHITKKQLSTLYWLNVIAVMRTPDFDNRISNPYRPISIVVDCIK